MSFNLGLKLLEAYNGVKCLSPSCSTGINSETHSRVDMWLAVDNNPLVQTTLYNLVFRGSLRHDLGRRTLCSDSF